VNSDFNEFVSLESEGIESKEIFLLWFCSKEEEETFCDFLNAVLLHETNETII